MDTLHILCIENVSIKTHEDVVAGLYFIIANIWNME